MRIERPPWPDSLLRHRLAIVSRRFPRTIGSASTRSRRRRHRLAPRGRTAMSGASRVSIEALRALAILTITIVGFLHVCPARAQSTATPPRTAAQLEQLVAPIALYPDSLLSQVLMASTYPLEVVEAARWSRENSGVTGQALDDAMQKQSWD